MLFYICIKHIRKLEAILKIENTLVINNLIDKLYKHLEKLHSIVRNYPLEPYGPYLVHKHLTNLTIKIVYS